MGFTVRVEDGRHLTNYCEGFNDQTRFGLAGAQLDYPAQVAEAATILNPRRLVLFHPHTDYFAYIGLASRPPAEFETAVRGAAPAVEVETVVPGRRLTL